MQYWVQLLAVASSYSYIKGVHISLRKGPAVRLHNVIAGRSATKAQLFV